MNNGSNKKRKAPSPQEAIQRLKESEKKLEKKSEKLEKKIDKESASAKTNAPSNKKAALIALKRKKRLEKQLQKNDGALSNIEFQRESLENVGKCTNKEVGRLKATDFPADSLKYAHAGLPTKKNRKLQEKIAKQHEISNKISHTVSKPVGFGEDVNEDELNAELEELEQEDLDQQLLNVGGSVTKDHLPSVPQGDIPEPIKPKASKEDDDLSELQAWAS